MIELNYRFDANSLLQSTEFELLCEPCSNLFDLYHLDNFLDKFVLQTVRPMIYEMDERTSDDALWMKLNYTMLMKTRAEAW